MKASDFARGYPAVEEDRIRQALRQHDIQQQQRGSFLRQELLPRAGIIAFLAGWSLMSAWNTILKNQSGRR